MPNYVHYDITRKRRSATNYPNKKKINFVVPDKLQNQVYDYIATLSIGTPAQTVKAAVDTGSSDLWVYAKGSGVSDSYDPSKSSTYQLLNNNFSIQYVKGSASGSWVTDNVDFGSDSVNSLQFATVSTPSQDGETSGVFGIAFASEESSIESGGSTYANFPVALKNSGKIKAVAYSLYLNSVTSTASSVTFGGLDTSKYSGTLWTIPFTQSGAFYVDFEVMGTKGNGVLDSGTSLTYLDQAIVDQIAQKYGATWNEQEGGYLLTDGAQPASQEPLTYTFANGAQVSVPVSELFLSDSDTSSTSILTIQATSNSQGITLLGDSFLRSAYVVYNLEGLVAGIAQANWSPGTSNIVEITDGTIPGSSNSSST